jgi:hypothetical protein
MDLVTRADHTTFGHEPDYEAGDIKVFHLSIYN